MESGAGLKGFEGEVVRPGDAEYDRRRAVWNAMHDRRPALIARCTSARDVVIALEHGRREGMSIAVRAGGHSMPGHSTCDDGIVIDLRPMNGVRVDADARRATVQGGVLLGELDRATQRHGLVAPAGVVSHTGVAGLTLGGGVGRLMRRFGLTIDSLLAAQVVTAAGRILHASEDQNADLFWGIRGGGGNFGVVTEFEFALHELSELLILATFHPLERAQEVLVQGREAMATGAPDELLWTSFLRKAPPLPWIPSNLVGVPGIMSLIEWSGKPSAGRRRLERLQAELSPSAGSLETVPFLKIQTLTDEIFAAGKRTYIKAGFATALTDALIEALIECGAHVGSEFSQIEVLAQGGAIGRVAPEATAFPHRDAAWLLNIPATWEDPAADGEEIGWARRSFAAIEPHLTGGKYVNFMGDDDRDDAGGAYGATLRRLRSVKRGYDPDNVFRLNHNIAP
ncbi:MAG TPA: FAD-binding oxidoreductase [Solirubrobacteraceae bacterium]|nr:FAD-binding oxidoreductase [Solirubrobacteraceae bacterium]